MRDHVAAPSVRDHVLVALAFGLGGTATLLAGRVPVSVFVTVVLLVAYTDLRGLLGERGHLTTFALGAGGVGALLWCGYTGQLDDLPSFVAVLVLALLVTRVVLNEAGARTTGVTTDLSATLGATGVVGVLGAHLLLLRSMPRVGFRGLLVLGLMVATHDAAAFFVGRFKGRHVLNKLVAPNKTWEGAFAGLASSVVIGLIAGIVLDPPFSPLSGPFFGAGVGVLATLGDLVFSAIKRSAGVRHSGNYLGSAGGALDVVDSLLFAAPAFYWAFRTIAL
jgi:phosphatidate cytidylyltransferase